MIPISVIIPSRKLMNLLPCMAHVLDREPSVRMIVIDDGLEFTSQKMKQFIYDNAEIIPGVKPFVYARNSNLGIQAAGTDDVILLNDDALLETRGGFTALQSEQLSHPEYGLIGSSMDSCGTPNQHRQPGNRLREEKVMIVFACVFIPRTTIDRIGLLDERFGVNAGGTGPRGYGCEDDDYSWRVRKEGLKLGVYDGCFVNHTTLKSTFRCDPARPVDVVAHEKMFRQKWGRSPRQAPPW